MSLAAQSQRQASTVLPAFPCAPTHPRDRATDQERNKDDEHPGQRARGAAGSFDGRVGEGHAAIFTRGRKGRTTDQPYFRRIRVTRTSTTTAARPIKKIILNGVPEWAEAEAISSAFANIPDSFSDGGSTSQAARPRHLRPVLRDAMKGRWGGDPAWLGWLS